MITGELKNQVDKIWEAFWTGGISKGCPLFWTKMDRSFFAKYRTFAKINPKATQ